MFFDLIQAFVSFVLFAVKEKRERPTFGSFTILTAYPAGFAPR